MGKKAPKLQKPRLAPEHMAEAVRIVRGRPASEITVLKPVDGTEKPPGPSYTSCSWTKSSMHFVPLKTFCFLKVLRTRDRIV